MAPFKSSRSTRNNDPATLNRGRGGIIDHDPTEGLPVRNWYLGQINIKQDEPAAADEEQQPSNTTNPDYPWPELRLPSFYPELPPLSQQIVRIARSGRPVKPSVYDKKTGTYISHAEYATRNTLKSKHLENVDSPAAEDDDDMDEELDVKVEMEKQERAFALKKWAQVPPAVADRRPEPKYLADRRPGMRSLYGFQAAVLNPALNANATGAAAGLDLGDGSGLGNAVGVLAVGADKPPMAVTPVKRMPPKRKKKGGPGRKKANLGPGPLNPNSTVGVDGAAGEGNKASGEVGQSSDTVKGNGDTQMEDAHDAEDDKGDEGSGSEEEGSEEGEIDEHLPHDTEMKLEEVVAQPTTEPTQLEAPPSPVVVTEPPITEVQAPTPEVIERVEPAPISVAIAEEPVLEPDLVAESVLPEPSPETVVPEPTEPSPPKVDFLKSLNDAVADQERSEE
jgi:hypothetical protein